MSVCICMHMSYAHSHHLLIQWLMYLWLVCLQTTALWGTHSHLLQPWHTLVSTAKPALQKERTLFITWLRPVPLMHMWSPDQTRFLAMLPLRCGLRAAWFMHLPAHLSAVTVNLQRPQGTGGPAFPLPLADGHSSHSSSENFSHILNSHEKQAILGVT